MRQVYAKLYDLLDARERRRAALLLLLIVLMGVADLAGAALILPLLAVVVDPEVIRTNSVLSFLFARLGFADDRSFLIFFGLAVFGVMLASLAVRLVTLYAMARFSYMRHHAISSRLFAAYLRQPYVWFLNRNSADLGRVVLAEVEQVVMQALLPALRLVANVITIIFLVGLLIAVNPQVALTTALTLSAAYALLSVFVRKALARAAEMRTCANHDRYRIAQEAMGGVKELKVLGVEQSYITRYGAASRRFTNAGSTAFVIGEMPRYVLETLAFGGMVLLILVMLVTGSGKLTEVIPVLGVFAFTGLKIFPALQQIYLALTYMRTVRPMLDNLHRDMHETLLGASVAPEGAQETASARLVLARSLQLAGVQYSYPQAERAALCGLDAEILARSTVGLVGGSGAGKTTTVDLILGLLEPQAGAIIVDGVPVTRHNLRHWQNAIGYVPQSIYLIDGTVAENIALGLPPATIDMAAVERAARTAKLHDFVVSELPAGYATPVGERGVRLSGGQRQRIGIARALYHDPEVLILDEATSALDNVTERALMEAVQSLGGQKTIIMIAHRLSTVRHCDQILLMEQGRIVAQGTYDALVAGNETFRQMANG